MSVIMTLRVQGDPKKLEEMAASNPDSIRSIADQAVENGLIAHRFYGSENEILVIDEWPDQESFQTFFDGASDRIGPMMEQVATGEPVITFWRKLDTKDDVGWDA